MPHDPCRFVIIGAGPTGLGAALRLLELEERDFLLIEGEAAAGGLAGSFVDAQGFTWDLGGHVQFSHYEKFDAYMDLALGKDGWIEHQRESWVWIEGRFVPYPFQYNLHRLPPQSRWKCVQGLLNAHQQEKTRPANFEEWILSTFGRGIADLFLLPYNFRVWAYPPHLLSAVWVGERVAVPSLEAVLEGVCTGEDRVAWGPNNTFRFPRHGGTGAIWRSLAEGVPPGNRRFADPVVAIDPVAKVVETAGGVRLGFERLISTMPLDSLADLIGDPWLCALTRELRYSIVHVVGVGLRGVPPESLQKKCWMYFPEPSVPFFRVTVFSNYSPNNTPEPGRTWSLMAEVSESAWKPVDSERVVDEVLAGMRATGLVPEGMEVLSLWYKRTGHGYPTPTLGRDAVVDQALAWLEARSIYSRGRFGAWRYEVSNQDHSFMQGVEVVDHCLFDRQELTLRQPALVNGRRNPFPYEEWT